MKKQIRNIVYACLGVLLIVMIPVFFGKAKPIALDIPEISIQKMLEQREREAKEAAEAAERKAAAEAVQRAFQCEKDDDCIIVSRDPCGCLVGPQGVTAVNVEHALVFAKKGGKAKACPDTPPSTVAQCSPSAQAVCWKNKCTIVY